MKPPSSQPSFTLLLASTRWAVHAFFSGLGAHGLPGITVEPMPEAIDDLSGAALSRAAAAAIDLAPNPLGGIAICRALRERQPSLPIVGLPDYEIGARLHLSPHTVKHHIEALRDEVGARNRIELAAWAGQNGFYAPGSSDIPGSVPVQVARSPQR